MGLGWRKAVADDTPPVMAQTGGPAEAGPERGNSGLLAQLRELTKGRYFSAVLLTLILVFALWLRVTGVNWDAGGHLHPDERFLSFVTNDTAVPGSIGEYFDSSSSSLNPYNRGFGSFVYGTFPLFTTKIAGEAADDVEDAPAFGPAISWLFDKTGNQDLNLGGYDANLVGRFLAGLFDVATVLLVFLLGRRLYGRNVGLLAAFLVTVTVLNIQHAHFFVVESFVTFFSLLTIFFSVRIAQDGGWRNYALAGLALGFALASKLSALPLLGIVGLAALIHVWPTVAPVAKSAWQQMRGPSEPAADSTAPDGSTDRAYVAIAGAVGGLALAIIAAFLLFRTAQPYAFSGTHFWDFGISDVFRDDISRLRDQQVGTTDFPPAIQWIGRTPYLFALKNMVLWGMGPALGLAAWGGVLYAGWRSIRHRESRHLLLLVWILGNFGYSAGQFVPSMRYLLPIYPPMVLLAAFSLTALWNADWSGVLAPRLGAVYRYARPALPAVAKGAVIATLALTTFWALAFTNIYRNPVSRVAAAEWLSGYAPPGSVIGSEHWDDGLSLDPAAGPFDRVEFTPFSPDNATKIEKLINDLDRIDFLTLTSNRVYGSVPQVPARYPETIRYYDLLFAEELGFRRVREFTSYPSFLGITIPDQSSEESFTVYDHPRVLIFEKTDEYSRERLESLLSGNRADLATVITPKDGATNALYLRPDDLEKQRAGGTWSDLFDTDSVANRLPLWTWLFVVELVSFAALPLALLLFRGLPDRGYLLSKPLGFLGLGYILWLGVSLKLFDFTRLSIALALVLMLLVGGAVAYRTWDNIQAFVRQHWRSILFWEALFLGAFVAFYMIRLANPDLWHPARGGEKPMDFAYLNAVVRSTTLPPIDPWFSGGYINYYYFGQFLTATLTKFTGIVPEVSYNLAVPLFFSLGVAATYSLVFNLAEATRRFIRRRPRGGRIGPRGPVLAGLAGVFLVMVAGNLGGAKQLVDNFSAISPWHVATPDLGTTLGVIIALIAILIGVAAAVLVALAVWRPVERFVGQGAAALPMLIVIGALVLAAVGVTVGFLMGTAAGGTVATLGGLKAVIFDGASLNLRTDWYWAPSRMMPGTNSITEFPFFSFLFADLHAHMMAIPFAITSLAVGGAVVLNATRLMRESAEYRRWAGWGLVVVLALVIGALRWINSWDYPPFLLMGIAAVVIAERVAVGSFSPSMLGRAALKTGVLVALTIIFFYPFQANYELPASGFQRMPGRETTPFHQYLAHFGVFLFLAGGFLAFLASRGIRRLGWRQFSGSLTGTFVAVTIIATIIVGSIGWFLERAPIDFSVTGLSSADFLRDLFGGIFEPLPGPPLVEGSADLVQPPGDELSRHSTPVVAFALAGIALMGLIGWFSLRRLRGDGAVRLLVLSMLALALILSAGVDIAVLNPDIQRQNTVFKFYLHTWVLLAIPAAFGTWYLLDVVRPRFSFRISMPTLAAPVQEPAISAEPGAPLPVTRVKPSLPVAGPRPLRVSGLFISAFAIGAVGLIVAALVYPVVATPQRVRDRFGNETAVRPRTDDGLAYMVGGEYFDQGGPIRLADDYAAIIWARENIEGSPTIIEGTTPNYRWGSRIAINTGLPAVAGWDFHQLQQRGKFGDLVQQRQADVTAFYSTSEPEVAQRILEKYSVRYVVIGTLERYYYPEQGIRNIEAGLGGVLRRVYGAGETAIYEVVSDEALVSADP